MKRTLDIDDALLAPLEIMGWYLDATVKAVVSANVEPERFTAHDEYGFLAEFSVMGDMHDFEIQWLDVGPIQVCKDKTGTDCVQLNPSTIPVSMRRQFEQAVERAVIEKAKATDDRYWDEEN